MTAQPRQVPGPSQCGGTGGGRWPAITEPLAFYPCFADRAQFEAWLDAASAWQKRPNPCCDCTAAYQARMLAAGRCKRPGPLPRFSPDERSQP